jgi:hypothetical protein
LFKDRSNDKVSNHADVFSRDDIANQKPNSNQVLGTKAMWDAAFAFKASEGTHAGIETDGTNFYTCSWQNADFSRYAMDGTFIETFTIAGVSRIRDLTYDGTYFYGSDATTTKTIYIMDLANETLIGTIPVTCTGVSAVRHIAYDPTLDGGNGGFWIGDWNELGAVSMAGTELVASTVTLNGCFGMAYDPHSDPANPCLWLFQQEGGFKSVFSQFDINTMSMTSVTHDCSDVPDYNEGKAGGACLYTSGGVAYLVGNIQQDPNLIVVYKLATDCSTPISTLPYIENFEDGFPPTCWTFINTHTNPESNWHIINNVGNPGDALETYWNDNNLMDEWAISPEFDLSGISGNIVLSFDFYMNYLWQVEENGSDVMVKVTTDGGNTWTQIWREEDYGTFNSYTWYTASIPFNAYAGKPSVKFAFQYLGNDGDIVKIDNVKLSGGTSINENAANQISVYPNPANEYVKVYTSELSNITITNLRGSIVYAGQVNNNDIISTEKFESGLYIVTIETKDNISRTKLIIN